MHHPRSGFTFIEMMVTIIIVAILAGIAVPSFQDLMQYYRIQSLSMEFSSALAYARSEAIKQGQTVTLCAANNTSAASCGQATNWANGWIMFTDLHDNGSIINPQYRLRVRQPLDVNSVFTTNQARISFNSRGFSSSGAASFRISDNQCTGNHSQLFEISNTGRLKITKVAC